MVTQPDRECRCDELDLFVGYEDSEAYSKHLVREWTDGYMDRYRCPERDWVWKRVWGVGAAHGYGPARLERVARGQEEEAFR